MTPTQYVKMKEALTAKQQLLLEFVRRMHRGQMRKDVIVKDTEKDRKYEVIEEPYYHHCLRVAYAVKDKDRLLTEAALLHDILEDQYDRCNEIDLFNVLVRQMSYDPIDAAQILIYVIELTDKFTKEKMPKHNRATRKLLEADRLSEVSYGAKTIKCADIVDNTKSIVNLDLARGSVGFSKIYLDELAHIMALIHQNGESGSQCDAELFNRAIGSILSGKNSISKINVKRDEE